MDTSAHIETDRGFDLLGWTVEPEACQLHRDGDTVRLEPKVMGVLAYLAERQGQVVSRDELLEAVWPDVVVTDSAVNRCVSELRRVFDDDPRDARVIETIPKRGYRLLVPIERTVPSLPEEPIADRASSPEVMEGRRDRVSLAVRVGMVVAAVLVLVVVGSLGSSYLGSPPPLESRPLTSLPGIERDAALSPDGSQAAFVWRSPDAASYDLYAQDLATSEPVALTATAANERFPAWSPDGRWIAFVRFESSACGLYLVSNLGTAERRLADCATPNGLSWSPDGAWIAVGEYDPEIEISRIVLLSPETLERRPLTTPRPGERGDFRPVFAPDGESVVFVRGGERYGTARLIEAELASGAERLLTPVLDGVVGVAWDATTGRPLVAAEYRGIEALWRVGDDAALQRVLYYSERMPRYPASAAGRTVAERWTYALDIASIGAMPFPAEVLSSTRADEQPAVSPRGDRVAFVSDRSGQSELWVLHADGRLVRPWTSPGDAESLRAQAPSWSPDGRWLVVEAHTADGVDIYAVPSAGGVVRQLTDHSAADLAPSVSRDGTWVYFGSIRGGDWQVWKVPFEGGDAVQVTDEGGYRALESVDGQRLYFARYGEPDLWTQPTDRSDRARRTAVLHPLDWGNWAVTERGLIAVDRSGPTSQVVVWENGAEEPTVLGPAGPMVRGEAGLTASLDGRVVLMTRASGFESDLVVLERAAR